MNLDGLVMRVSSTAEHGVVSGQTYLRLVQKGSRIFGRYTGGTISRGYLVGVMLTESQLIFRYTQVENSGAIHGGTSLCDVTQGPDGRVRILEHFTWRTRTGFGTNVFDEVH